MIVVGLAGNMASGKSTVAKMFAERGFIHVEADALVHKLTAEDPETIAALREAFPDAWNGVAIDRQVIVEIFKRDPSVLKTLEAIYHPRVRAEMQRLIADAGMKGDQNVLLDVPLMFEMGAEMLCDKVVLVSADSETRRIRGMQRPGMTQEKWETLSSRQMPEEQMRERVDAVITTDESLEHTQKQVDGLIGRWRHAARDTPEGYKGK